VNLELREYLSEINEDLVLIDGFDDAIIGLAERCGLCVLVYNKEKIIHILTNDNIRKIKREVCR
jgi:hypothetical protein